MTSIKQVSKANTNAKPVSASERDIFTAKTILPSENGQDVLDTPKALLDSAKSPSSNHTSYNPTACQFLINYTYGEGNLPRFGVSQPEKGVVTQQPEHGIVSQYTDGTFSYIPHDGIVGDDVFEFTVSNGTYVSTESITVSVLYPNHGPDAISDVLCPDSGQVMFRFSHDHLLEYRILSIPQDPQENNYEPQETEVFLSDETDTFDFNYNDNGDILHYDQVNICQQMETTDISAHTAFFPDTDQKDNLRSIDQGILRKHNNEFSHLNILPPSKTMASSTATHCNTLSVLPYTNVLPSKPQECPIFFEKHISWSIAAIQQLRLGPTTMISLL